VARDRAERVVTTPVSPAIDDDGWGRIVVGGQTWKDAKLWPGGGRSWDWTETGTSHGGGIQPGDVEELLARGAEHVVLSRGRQRRLGVDPDTTALLDRRGVAWEQLRTDAAIARYDELRRAGVAVGALLHTTC
jgi:hypothetical protein